jgi:hypothetical protein
MFSPCRDVMTEFDSIYTINIIFFIMAQQPLVDQALLIIEASQSHSDTPHSVGLLWTSDQPDTETSTWQQATDIYATWGIRTRNPQNKRP